MYFVGMVSAERGERSNSYPPPKGGSHPAVRAFGGPTKFAERTPRHQSNNPHRKPFAVGRSMWHDCLALRHVTQKGDGKGPRGPGTEDRGFVEPFRGALSCGRAPKAYLFTKPETRVPLRRPSFEEFTNNISTNAMGGGR